MKNLSKIPHSKSYKRQDIPDHYHYKNHERIGDILLVLEPGYEIHERPRRMNKVFILFLFLFFAHCNRLIEIKQLVKESMI